MPRLAVDIGGEFVEPVVVANTKCLLTSRARTKLPGRDVKADLAAAQTIVASGSSAAPDAGEGAQRALCSAMNASRGSPRSSDRVSRQQRWSLAVSRSRFGDSSVGAPQCSRSRSATAARSHVDLAITFGDSRLEPSPSRDHVPQEQLPTPPRVRSVSPRRPDARRPSSSGPRVDLPTSGPPHHERRSRRDSRRRPPSMSRCRLPDS